MPMGLFGHGPHMYAGSWRMWSKKDPRWNASGYTHGFLQYCCPCTDKIEELKGRLGAPPDDLQWILDDAEIID